MFFLYSLFNCTDFTSLRDLLFEVVDRVLAHLLGVTSKTQIDYCCKKWGLLHSSVNSQSSRVSRFANESINHKTLSGSKVPIATLFYTFVLTSRAKMTPPVMFLTERWLNRQTTRQTDRQMVMQTDSKTDSIPMLNTVAVQ